MTTAALTPTKPAPLEVLMSTMEGPLGEGRRLRRPRWYLYLALVFLAALIGWMAVAQVDQVVRTQGRLIPGSKPQLVQHLEGGIVSKVHVREGDRVSKGDPLVAVSDLLASSSRGERQARLNGLNARAARLQAEANGTRIQPPPGLAADSEEMRNETAAYSARQATLLQTLRVLEEQINQRSQERVEQEARRRGLSAELEVARQQLAVIAGLQSKNAASQMETLEARARVERLTTQLKEAETALPRLLAAASELQARYSEATAQFRSEARSALADTRVELERLTQELTADADRILRTEVVAPADGTVNKLLFNTVGGVVRPGETLLELTPANGDLFIEAKASPSERGVLQVGQTAIVRIAAFDFTTHGTVRARVTEISADSLTDERGDRYFRVAMALDADSLAAFGKPLTPGMTLTADSVTGQRTILEYVLSPIKGLAQSAFRDRK
ncbi:MAG: HlyD family type I secretion periplasmic adaptor subunit [Ideonella sp. WA131b]|jgi:adhesin transport system membrane fusion protein|nr:HlyD family type I secretion periplasmic adaptor subunit [Ideonella sp. WA131b]